MKRWAIVFFLLLPTILSAQISLGMMVGANIGKFGGVEPPDISYTHRTGSNVGVTAIFRITRDVSLAFQPTYSQRGSNIETGEDTRWDTLKVYQVKINFLVLPLFVRIDADNGITYFVSGLEFALPLSAEVVFQDQSWDISHNLSNTDILASIGMGFRIPFGQKNHAMLEVRYYQGLVNFNYSSEEEKKRVIYENFKNSGFQIMLGIERVL